MIRGMMLMAHKSLLTPCEEIIKIPEWLTGHASDAESVFQFCQHHNLLGDLKTAFDLVKEAFASGTKIGICLTKDPEASSEDVIIKVTVKGSVAGFRRAYRSVIPGWCSSLPAEALALI